MSMLYLDNEKKFVGVEVEENTNAHIRANGEIRKFKFDMSEYKYILSERFLNNMKELMEQGLDLSLIRIFFETIKGGDLSFASQKYSFYHTGANHGTVILEDIFAIHFYLEDHVLLLREVIVKTESFTRSILRNKRMGIAIKRIYGNDDPVGEELSRLDLLLFSLESKKKLIEEPPLLVRAIDKNGKVTEENLQYSSKYYNTLGIQVDETAKLKRRNLNYNKLEDN